MQHIHTLAVGGAELGGLPCGQVQKSCSSDLSGGCPSHHRGEPCCPACKTALIGEAAPTSTAPTAEDRGDVSSVKHLQTCPHPRASLARDMEDRRAVRGPMKKSDSAEKQLCLPNVASLWFPSLSALDVYPCLD